MSSIVLCLPLAGAPVASAGPTSGRSVVITMGDSMIAGAAGRWKGNSLTDSGSKAGTDRACVPGPAPGSCSRYDLDSVYVDGTSGLGKDQCQRSDVSEALSSRIPGWRGINIACGAARSSTLSSSSQGGTRWNTEPPQGDRLRSLARKNRVRMIVVDTGANDTDFGPAVVACAESYAGLGPESACEHAEATFVKGLPHATHLVEHAVTDIRRIMKAAGYRAGSYRLVLQDYAVGVAPVSQTRYPEADKIDRVSGGCPFSNASITWIKTVGAAGLATMVETAAKGLGTEYLSIGHLLDRHEVCSVHDNLVSSQHPASASTSEWSRFLSPIHGTAQALPLPADRALGDVLHPNYFAQRALGTCLTKTAAAAPGQHACTTKPGTTRVELTTTKGRSKRSK